MAKNFERMMQLVNEVFDTRNDADQISVDTHEAELLGAIHTNTLTELTNEDGPIVWLLLIPTSTVLMEQFVAGAIPEKQVLCDTKPGDNYDAIYLCSALVLPEFRGKGLAKKAALNAIAGICKDHTIKALFYWPFSEEGKGLAVTIAAELGLPLYERLK